MQAIPFFKYLYYSLSRWFVIETNCIEQVKIGLPLSFNLHEISLKISFMSYMHGKQNNSAVSVTKEILI